MSKKPTLAQSVGAARKQIKVQPGLKILVTPELVEYWKKHVVESSIFSASAVLMVFSQDMALDWNVGAVEGSIMLPLPEHLVRAGAVAHQVMQLGFTAERFFRAVADKCGGVYQGMERLSGAGWVGHLLMTEHPEKKDETYRLPENGLLIYAWVYTAVLPDAAMENPEADPPQELIDGYAQNLAMTYFQNKFQPQPKEYVQ